MIRVRRVGYYHIQFNDRAGDLVTLPTLDATLVSNGELGRYVIAGHANNVWEVSRDVFGAVYSLIDSWLGISGSNPSGDGADDNNQTTN